MKQIILIIFTGLNIIAATKKNSPIASPWNTSENCKPLYLAAERLREDGQNLQWHAGQLVPEVPQEQRFQEFETKLDNYTFVLLREQEEHFHKMKQLISPLLSRASKKRNNLLYKELQDLHSSQRQILLHFDLESSWKDEAEEVSKDISDYCSGIYERLSRDLHGNLSILDAIDIKLAENMKNFMYASNAHRKGIEENLKTVKQMEEKAMPQVCLRLKNKQQLCSPASYPYSCETYDPNFCDHNKCWIQNPLLGPEPFQVQCDNRDGGNWLIIQRRLNGSVDFERNWLDYKRGFGGVEGEFWIGLDKLHALTHSMGPMELLIILQDHKNVEKYAKYQQFAVGNESQAYYMEAASGYEGNAGDSFSWHQDNAFTTLDRDNDGNFYGNCAQMLRGGWWHNDCGWSNLNGLYYQGGRVTMAGTGINWGEFHGYDYSMKRVLMMIRRWRGDSAKELEFL